MKKLKFMVVDDSGLTAQKLAKMIEEIGHTVSHIAKTGRDAVNVYGIVKPDMVTMDITMPDMNGIEATKLIKEKDPKALIIMVTSHGQEQMVVDAIKSGALGYVIKPVKIEKLEEHINKVIEKYGNF